MYDSPKGPPPGRSEEFQPPSGPPPGYSTDPAPNMAWTAVPDTSELPPPPSSGYEQPLHNNAEATEADRAHRWCVSNPLRYPQQPPPELRKAVGAGDLQLSQPQEYRGRLSKASSGRWEGHSDSRMKDASLIATLPTYFAAVDSPVHTGQNKTIYYEVEIRSLGRLGASSESTIALGYVAIPQPTWRLPGWQRASLGVHSDDGHRFVNDPWGGKDCTKPFGTGDTIGIGMTFSVPKTPPEYNVNANSSGAGLLKSEVEVFLTRNGKKDASWDLHEELDHDTDQGIEGLDGLFDVYPSIGIFGEAKFDVKFRREEWMWRPSRRTL